MLLIYSPKITNRCKYIFHLVFKDVLGVDFEIVSDIDRFKNYTHEKINYSQNAIGDEVFIQCHKLLFETGIGDQNIQVFEWEHTTVFCATGKNSAFPFDPFAAAFFLVSRYEEYLPHIRDKHDRYNAFESIAYKNNFLHKPVVNTWVGWIKKLLQNKFPDMKFPERKYKYVSTIDIDNAFAYKEKGVMRTLGGYAKSLTVFDLPQMAERTKVLMGTRQDPYDTYEMMFDIQRRYKLHPIYFMLLGDYGDNDKNISPENHKFRSLIKNLADHAEVGIHPSYASNGNKPQLQKEVKRLSSILNREITKSRQHFLKLRFPDTYRSLIELDITDEYSMGYANQVGFRAGICTPFNFYDLDLEVETRLKVHPFAVMDATLKHYMKVDPEDAMDYIKPLVDEVRAVNGVFMSLWHNETLSNDKVWFGWRGLYEDVVKYAHS
jgi:hypothetical protein